MTANKTYQPREPEVCEYEEKVIRLSILLDEELASAIYFLKQLPGSLQPQGANHASRLQRAFSALVTQARANKKERK